MKSLLAASIRHQQIVKWGEVKAVGDGGREVLEA